MIEEDFLGVGGICGDITITRLGIIRIFGFLPLDRRTRDISLVVELRPLYPTFGHGVVTQIPDNVVITATGVVGICRGTIHRRYDGRSAKRLVILLTLFLYLRHASGIVFLNSCNVVATDATDIAELLTLSLFSISKNSQ